MRNFLDILRRNAADPSHDRREGRSTLSERECRTPGSEFHITIEPDEIGGIVDLPPEIDLDGMDREQAENAEDMIHDALEDVVAKLVAEIDAEADAHWEQARENDPVQEEQALTELKRPNLGSAWVVIEDPETGMLLLGKRAKAANNAGQWNLFGGGIEGNETPIQTALRELWEEGGIQATADQVTKLPGTPPNLTIFVLPMTAQAVQSRLRLNPKEVSKVRWCDPDALPENLHKSALGLLHASRTTSDEPGNTGMNVNRAMRHTMDLVGEARRRPFDIGAGDHSLALMDASHTITRMTEALLLEMPMDRADFIAEVRSARRQVTYHLIKILAFEAPDETRRHWKSEITNWLLELTGVRFTAGKKGGHGRAPRFEEFFALLFESYFGHPTEARRIGLRIQALTSEYPNFRRIDLTDEQLRSKIEIFYRDIIPSMCTTDLDISIIDAL